MNKLSSVLKATMSGGFQIFNYRGKTDRSRRIMPFLLGILIGILMLSSACVMVMDLKEDGAQSAILSIYTLLTAVIIVTEGVYKSSDLLFKPRDNDMLLAMPIPKSTIVFSRMIKFYVFEFLYCLIFLLPAIIAYAIGAEVDASYWLVGITMLILIPVIPIALSCIVGLISSAFAGRFKHRTLFQVLFSFVALFVFAVIILAMNTTSDIDGKSMMAVSEKINTFYYPASVFVDLSASFNIWQYLLFVLINLVVLAVTVFVISKFYFQIVTRMNIVKGAEKTTRTNYDYKRHSQTFAMVKKEITKYFSTPVLLMNTAVGLMLFLVATGALCFKIDDIMASFATVEDFPLTTDDLYSYLPSVAFAMVAFTSLMTFITTTMISLEGKAFNMLKSMPISGMKVIMTKVLAAMLLIVPVTFLGTMVMFVKFRFNLLDGLLVLVGVFAIPLVTELIGILIDLKYARFDSETDAQVVKQSAGVMVSTFLGLGMVLVTISLTFALVFVTGQTAGLAMMDGIFIVISLFLLMLIATRGEEKIMKLTA